MTDLFEEEDGEEDEELRKKAPEAVGGGTMRPGVKLSKFLQEKASPVKKNIRKLDKIRQEAQEPTHPRSPIEGSASLKEKIDDQD